MKTVVLVLAFLAASAPAVEAQEKKPEVSRERADAADARAVAQKAAHFEKVYRDRIARIDRLQTVYREKGEEAKLAELKDMRAKLEKRHANAMDGFRKQLGEGRWKKVEEHIGGPSARALEVRNDRANENAAERDARKARKEAEGKQEKPPKEKERKDKP